MAARYHGSCNYSVLLFFFCSITLRLDMFTMKIYLTNSNFVYPRKKRWPYRNIECWLNFIGITEGLAIFVRVFVCLVPPCSYALSFSLDIHVK